MLLRLAKKLHNGDEVELKMGPGVWVAGWVVGDVTLQDIGKLAVLDVRLPDGRLFRGVNHFWIR